MPTNKYQRRNNIAVVIFNDDFHSDAISRGQTTFLFSLNAVIGTWPCEVDIFGNGGSVKE